MGGHCLLEWPKVPRPKELGGLGISSLRELNCALRIRCIWLRKTEPDKPWVSFPFQLNNRVEALFLWDVISEITLQPSVPDKYIWRLSSSGQYPAKSDYNAMFEGSVLFGPFGPWGRIWKSWAPAKCRFFMWLVAHSRCWTAELTVWPDATSRIWITILCVIKKMRQSTTCSLVFLLAGFDIFSCSGLVLLPSQPNPMTFLLMIGGAKLTT
jgi:hypothetical protein